MKTFIPYFMNFPADFEKRNMAKIAQAFKKGKNIQLVGPRGSGKSLLLRSLSVNHYFNSRYRIYNINLNLLTGYSGSDFKSLIEREIGGNLESVLKADKPVLIILDSYGFINKNIPQVANILKGMVDNFRDYLSVIVSVERPIKDYVLFGETIFAGPLSETDFEWFWKGIRGQDKFKDKIIKASGGFLALVKRLNEIAENTGEIDVAIQNPKIFPHLNYQLELLKEDLEGEAPFSPIPIYDTFLRGVPQDSHLTKLEYKAFNLLRKNESKITDRETLIEAIWGKNSIEVADHALDQLMHRLKVKLNKFAKIDTVRGRGYRFRSL